VKRVNRLERGDEGVLDGIGTVLGAGEESPGDAPHTRPEVAYEHLVGAFVSIPQPPNECVLVHAVRGVAVRVAVAIHMDTAIAPSS